ncbi:ComEC/Rec2 family competence protein [Ilyobacter polytropus]|uniref:ComEC/Rec2-related protein n=1 Tax=Ilyobacter polytropus (strain ATCC 51220 / DSM 2926 / LMG 16218 / CuHBu1) TaxID=572544 RepID=E3HAL8_ILYPC|nr:ComEC/Rec2 family competence protein [Ilyobacter polytropus]ADO83205.1 ComEC/Rec2-related protein [Ilyobacter polytropus DSM 2926]
METTYLAALELLIMSLAFCFFSLWIATAVTVFLVVSTFFMKNRSKLLLVIALLFVVRIFTGVDLGSYNKGENIVLKVNGGNNKIERINRKIPRKALYIYGNNLEDGKSEIKGILQNKIEKNNREYYQLEEVYTTPIPKGFVNRYLDEKISTLTREYSGDMAKFYRAVILGEKGNLSDKVKNMFSYTGTSHLIVISGLHIGVIIAIILFLTGKLPLQRELRYFISAVILTLYTVGVGLAPSVLRAYIMGMCYIGGELFYEKPDPKKSLSAAFVISLMINPVSVMELSFQMSFMAVVAIIFIYPKVEKKLNSSVRGGFIKKVLLFAAMSLTIQIFLTPIFLVYFRTIPILSFLVNLVAIPLGVLFVQNAFGALVLSVVGLGGILMPTVNLSYHILLKFIEITSNIPALSVNYYGIKKSGMIILLYSVIFGMAFLRGRWKGLSVIPLFILLFIDGPDPPEILDYKGIVYYREKPGILVSGKRISDRDIIFLRDNGVKAIEVLISTEKTDEKLKKILKVSEELILFEGDEVKLKTRTFINIKGKIVELERIEKTIQI